jgi:signal transduction histidine kinase/CheY-like chemotaxis protein
LRPYIETALAGKPVHFQVRVTYPDGVTRDVGVTYSPDIGADGLVNGYAVLVVDESDRRRAEVERERLLAAERSSREAAERAGRIKDQFLAVLSHELRTPLTPVLLIVSRLEGSPELPEPIREDVASIRRSIELEARLIDDLLDVTRISRGKVRYDFQTVELHALVRSAMSICCGDDKLSVSADFAASHTLVHGDPGRLQQVFCNLLNNAWKFTPPGGSVAVHTENADGFVRVDITDTGSGIDPEVLPRVFDAFEQGDAARARRFGGLGLGLAISKAMVDAHEGRISASSQGHGQGACFRVELPTVSAPISAGRNPASPPAHPVEQRKLRVLVVEDHPSTLRALSKLLSVMGHEVDGATSVADGLRIADEGRYDLVVSDLGLPDGTGYELMRQLRSTHGLRGIALSGYGMEEDIARSREAGFAEHLVKPVDLQKLQAAIGRFGMERAADPVQPIAVPAHEESGPKPPACPEPAN